MDFEKIDVVDAPTLAKGDIVSVIDKGFRSYLQITGPVDDDGTGVLVFSAHNLSDGEDDDSFIIDEWDTTDIYRSY